MYDLAAPVNNKWYLGPTWLKELTTQLKMRSVHLNTAHYTVVWSESTVPYENYIINRLLSPYMCVSKVSEASGI